MKNYFPGWMLLAAASFAATNVIAQQTATSDPNWISLSPYLGFNISARFKHLGNVSPASQPGPTAGGGVDRTYDDGFVRVDSSGNQGGLTWFWGYNNASQVQGDTLRMHSGASASANGALEKGNDPQMGFELAYGRRLGEVLRGHWGLEAAFGFTDISIRDNRSLTGTGLLATDAYSLGGIVPPQAPYSGSFSGPGPLIGDAPTRTAASTSLLVTGKRTLDAQLYGLRLGPYFELPITKRFAARLGAGLAVAVVSSDFSFNETAAFASGPSVSRSGSNSNNDILAGGYFSGQLSYAVTERTSFFAGAQYQYLGKSSQSAAGGAAVLDLSHGIFVTLGVRLSF
jgi:hypothetical protein